MKKLVLFSIVLVLFLSYTIQGVHADRTLTKAICSDDSCQDFLISCYGSLALDLKPISGFVVIGDDWTDLREDRLC